MSIPELLLTLPVPTLPLRYVDAQDGTLCLTVAEASAERTAYMRAVATALHQCNASYERDIVPALVLAMQLFNAENFTGELTASERANFEAVYTRFGFYVVDVQALTGRQLTSEQPPSSVTNASSPAVTETTTDTSILKNNNAALQNTYFHRLLTVDGEMPSPCMRFGGLLLCALAIVEASTSEHEPSDINCTSTGDESGSFVPLTSPWRLRVFFRHQLCLTHRAHSIFRRLTRCVDALLAQGEAALTVTQLLEIGQVQSYYYHRDLAAATFRAAQRQSGLRVEETAMLGVRTRWQQQAHVQALVQAESTLELPKEAEQERMRATQPVTVMSESDGHDLLDRPRAQPEAPPINVAPLHPLDKAIILALCMDIRNRNPLHGLTQHKMLIYVERLLVDPAPAPFVVRSYLLLLRARLESRRNRVQERAFMQLTELVEQFAAERPGHSAHAALARVRDEYVYTVPYPPIWQLSDEYADFCFDETLYKTALDTYERTLHWEKIIECCKKLDKRRRAEFLARALLRHDPRNPLLWVALGEATREEAHLWHAWELCEGQMAAPMRSLARLALEREQYDKVVDYFDAAVRVNPVFGGDWFALGYAALKLRRWERGAEAFTRACQTDPNDAYAWNNLASMLLRDAKLRPAFNAMSQALRNNRRDWRMWLNYFSIGCQLGEATETAHALGTALDIAKRQLKLDPDAMRRFVDITLDYLQGKVTAIDEQEEDSHTAHEAHATGQNTHTESTTNAESNVSNGETVGHCNSVMPAAASMADTTASLVVQSIPHADLQAEEDAVPVALDEGDDAAFAQLVPLGADVAMPALDAPTITGDATALAVDSATHAAVQADIRRRHADRVRQLFTRLLDTFVTDPELYDCAARFFGGVDGPFAAYRYRLKELRACQQQDQWTRDETRFCRTVTCLRHAVDDLQAAAAARQVESHSNNNNNEAATSETTTEGGSMEALVQSVKELQGHIRATLDVTEEHMEAHSEYAVLRQLSSRLRDILQQLQAHQ